MDTLPLRIQSKILGHLNLSDQLRQVLREVCSTWQQLLDSVHPVHLRLKNGTNNLYDAMCPLAIEKGLTRKGYSVHLIDMIREFTMNLTMTPHVKKASFVGHYAPYNLQTVLETCQNLETLILNLSSKQWSPQFLRPETPPRPHPHHHLKNLRIEMDCLGGEVKYINDPCENEILFLNSLSNGGFSFPALETLTLIHLESTGTHFNIFSRDRIPNAFFPEESFGARFLRNRNQPGDLNDHAMRMMGFQPRRWGGRLGPRDPGLVHHPPDNQMVAVAQRQGQGQQPTPFFLQFIGSLTPNLKTLILGGIPLLFYQRIAQEEDLDLTQTLTQLEDIVLLWYPHTNTTMDIRTRAIEFRPIPKFLLTLPTLRSIELPVGFKESELNLFNQLLERHHNTLEALSVTFTATSPRGLIPRFRGSLTLALDLAIFSNLSKCSSLTLTITNQTAGGHKDSVSNTSLLPESLKVFKTNFSFSFDNLTGLASGTLKNLEVVEIYEYIGMMGRGQGQGQVGFFAHLQRDLLNHNPNMKVCTIIQSTGYEEGLPPPRELSVDAYPTGQ